MQPSIICPLICRSWAWFTSPSPPLTFWAFPSIGHKHRWETQISHCGTIGLCHSSGVAGCNPSNISSSLFSQVHIFSFHWNAEKQWFQVSSVLTRVWWQSDGAALTTALIFLLTLYEDPCWSLTTEGSCGRSWRGGGGHRRWLAGQERGSAFPNCQQQQSYGAMDWQHSTHKQKHHCYSAHGKKLREETCGQPIMGGGYYVP